MLYKLLRIQIEKAVEEINYFEGLLQQITSASTRDIEEIREELAEEGYLRLRQKKGKRRNPNTSRLLKHICQPMERKYLVGKNNKQNDYLTSKLAAQG